MCLVSFSQEEKYASLEKLQSFNGKPRWAYIVITDSCSHRCPWCYGAFGLRDGREMNLDEFEIVMDKLESMGVSQITLSGGEPTEHLLFGEFLERASRFHLHIASHGEHIDNKLANRMNECGVRQVQINFQGSDDYDRIHQRGSHAGQARAIRLLLERDIEVVAMVTVGKYNIGRIGRIFGEAADLGVSRLRVWETTGRGSGFLKDLDVRELFRTCAAEAAKLGYTYSLSYDPEYTGDVSIPCLQLSNLYLYIDSSCALRLCGAVEDAPVVADFVHDSADVILGKYLRMNNQVLGNRSPWCMARSGSADANRVISRKRTKSP